MRIAIVGAGISGLGAARLLYREHEIVVYEKERIPGGHSRTIDIVLDGVSVPVDIGYIVFNYRNYPQLGALFEALEVPVVGSSMSFGASIDGGWLEYGTRTFCNLFAQKRNLFRPAFWAMLADVLRFNRCARDYMDHDPGITLGEVLAELRLNDWATRYFLLAMGGSIWSTPLQQMLAFPARTFVRFFDNHGLLETSGQPRWYTVKGGSYEYVRRLIRPFEESIRTGCAARSVVRCASGVEVVDGMGVRERFDAVVMACHSDQALGIIDSPTEAEREVLRAIRYQKNTVVLHRDVSFMPRRRDAWSSWVYLSDSRGDDKPVVSLSYWMNRLQDLPVETPVIVTLNASREPCADSIFHRETFEHPVFDKAAIGAQSRLESIQGQGGIWYAGAWQRYGFHEDGLQSALDVVARLGVSTSWI